MNKKSNNEIHLRLSGEDYNDLINLAGNMGLSRSELCRKIIHEYISSHNINKGLDIVIMAIQENLKILDSKFFELKELENRILTTVTLNKFLNLSTLNYSTNLSSDDIKEIYNGARKEAYLSLRTNDISTNFETNDNDSAESNEFINKIF